MFSITPVFQQKPLANRFNLHHRVFSQAMGKRGRALSIAEKYKVSKAKPPDEVAGGDRF